MISCTEENSAAADGFIDGYCRALIQNTCEISELEEKLDKAPGDYELLVALVKAVYPLFEHTRDNVHGIVCGSEFQQRIEAAELKYEQFADMLVTAAAGDCRRSCAVGEMFLQMVRMTEFPENRSVPWIRCNAALANALDCNPDYARTYLLQAEEELERYNADFVRVAKLCNTIRRLMKSDSTLNAAIGEADVAAIERDSLAKLSEPSNRKTVGLLNELLEYAGARFEYLELRADCYAAAGEWRKAEADYLQAISMLPEITDNKLRGRLHGKTAVALLANHKVDEAFEYSNSALKLDEDNHFALEVAGDIARINWNYQSAGIYYYRAAKAFNNADGILGLKLQYAIYGNNDNDWNITDSRLRRKIALCRSMAQARKPKKAPMSKTDTPLG